MELSGSKQETLTRLAVCVIAALILYSSAKPLCSALKLPLWEEYRPWLEKNRIQAIAVVSAVLFGLSLAPFPLEAKPEEEPPPCEDDFQPVA